MSNHEEATSQPPADPALVAVRALRALLRARGLTDEAVARRMRPRVHMSLVNKTVLGRRTNRDDIRRRIAKLLELPYEHVWGEHAATHLSDALREELTRQRLAQVDDDFRRAMNG